MSQDETSMGQHIAWIIWKSETEFTDTEDSMCGIPLSSLKEFSAPGQNYELDRGVLRNPGFYCATCREAYIQRRLQTY